MPKLGSASPGPNPQPLEFALELSSAGQARVSRHAYIGELRYFGNVARRLTVGP